MSAHTNVQNFKFIFKGFLFPVFLIAFIFTSCQKEATISLDEKVATTQESALSAAEKLMAIVQERGIVSKLELLKTNSKFTASHVSSLPTAGNRSSNANLLRQLANNESFKKNNEILKRAINPDDYECEPTFINDYIRSITQDFTAVEGQLLGAFGIIPFFEALLLDTETGGDHYGANGEFTSSIQKSFVKLKSFWDIPADIQLADMHGDVFKNVPVVAQVLQAFFVDFDADGNPIAISAEDALEFAEFLKVAFGSDVFDNYSHPLLTFNAVAISANPPFWGNKIIMGDGIMQAYADLGFRTIAEGFILAHEYGHQIQFANNYFEDGPRSPEGTRRTELMADAYAAYFTAYGKKLFPQLNIIKRFLKTSNSIGDCGFGSNGHHGTPNQREKAAEFGGKLTERRSLRDEKLTSQEFFELFEEALPEIVAPDAN